MAVCVAIIGKDNAPKYFSCTNPDEELNLQYKVLSSLDVVEEKLSGGNKGSDLRELYLGILYSLETHKIFGYVTNTKIKFIIVVESSNTSLRDNEIRSCCELKLLKPTVTDLYLKSSTNINIATIFRSFNAKVKSIMTGAA